VVQLEKFEGPLGLLLYLIRREDMDIYDIEIHKITGQFLDYIRRMKELNLEVAGEFIAMAATLIQIKSQMLLPQYDENNQLVEEDPRKELVARLLEYQAFKEVAQKMYQRPLLNRDWWARPRLIEIPLDTENDEMEIVIDEDNALYALISSYRKAVRRVKDTIHRVQIKVQSVHSRILELRNELVVGAKTTLFDILTTPEEWKQKILVTFLSLLELSKQGYISIHQPDNFGNIYIEPKRAIDEGAVLRTEEYDTHTPTNLFEVDEFEVEPLVTVNEENVVPATDEELLAAEKEIGEGDANV
jgi:segregation and condensation protein A